MTSTPIFRPLVRPFALTLIAAALTLAGTTAHAADASKKAEMDAQVHIMTGEMAAGRDQPALAASEFLKALETIKDPDLANRATSLALSAQDADLSLATAKRWLELEPNAQEAREVIARVSLLKGDTAEAYKQCEAIITGVAGGEDDGFMQIARLLSLANESQADNALKVMNQLVVKWPQSAAAHHARSLLELRFNKNALAYTSAQRAIHLDPLNKEHRMLLVGVLVKQGKIDEADAEFEQTVKDDPKITEMRMGYAKLLLESDQRDAARVQIRLVLKDKPDHIDAHYALGVMAFNDRDYDEAEQEYKRLLNTKRSIDAAYQLGRVEEARKNYAQALNWYEQVTKGEVAIDAVVRRAYVLAQVKQVDAAQSLMVQLRDELPQFEQRFYLAEGDLLLSVGETDRALKMYDESLQAIPDDIDLLYGRSLVLERTGKIELAEKDLRAMIAKDADDSRAMNALGYMLTVHTQRYDEASKLISRALELSPNDAAVMDSMGWVQFKLGKKDEARATLQKAFDKFPDPEVAAHLGEVLWSLGEKDQARALWEQAMQQSPDATALRATIDRLTK
ncbi:MAG: tetratricopeptide repeat protein [Pseudomonadota bacterium]